MSTKYRLRITGECKQNMKLCKRRGLPMDELWTVVGKLLNGEQLEENLAFFGFHPDEEWFIKLMRK